MLDLIFIFIFAISLLSCFEKSLMASIEERQILPCASARMLMSCVKKLPWFVLRTFRTLKQKFGSMAQNIKKIVNIDCFYWTGRPMALYRLAMMVQQILSMGYYSDDKTLNPPVLHSGLRCTDISGKMHPYTVPTVIEIYCIKIVRAWADATNDIRLFPAFLHKYYHRKQAFAHLLKPCDRLGFNADIQIILGTVQKNPYDGVKVTVFL